MGGDVIAYDDPQRVGMIGSYGNRWANIALGKSDFLLVLGSRLDIRQTGSEAKEFKGGRTIFHVDCETGELNNRVVGCDAHVADLNDFLRQALAYLATHQPADRSAWMAEIKEQERQWPDTRELTGTAGINPNEFIHQLSARHGKVAAAYCIDVGQHQMWAAQSMELGPDQRFLTSGGMGSMGFALPAAVGAAPVTAPRPSPGHPTASRQARWSTHSPSGTISPVSSATGMKAAGGTGPRTGWVQRISASSPVTRSPSRSTSGW